MPESEDSKQTGAQLQSTDEKDMVRSRALRGGGILTATAVITRGLNFARGVVLARLLAPEDFGGVAYVYAIFGFVSVLTTFRTEEVIASARHERDKVADVGFTVHVGLAAIRALLLVLLAPSILAVLDHRDLTPILRVAALISIASACKISRAQMSQELRFGGRALPEVVEAVVAIAACTGFALSGFGLWTLLLGPLCGDLAYLVALHTLLSRRPRLALHRDVLREVAGVSWPLYLLFISVWIYWTADDFIVGHWLGREKLGYYSRAFQLPQHMLAFQGIVGTIVLPSFARLLGDREHLSAAFSRAIRVSATAILPCAAIFVPLAKPTIVHLFGARWEPSALPFAIFTVAVVLKAAFGSATELFISLRKTRLLLYLHLPNSGLLLLLAPAAVAYGHGISGVAVATFLPLLVSVPLVVWCVKQEIAFSVWRTTWQPAAVAVCVAALAWLCRPYTDGLIGFLIVLAGLGLAYVGGVMVTMRDMREMLAEFVERLWAKDVN